MAKDNTIVEDYWQNKDTHRKGKMNLNNKYKRVSNRKKEKKKEKGEGGRGKEGEQEKKEIKKIY